MEWISIKDKLPEDGQYVIIWIPRMNESVFVKTYYKMKTDDYPYFVFNNGFDEECIMLEEISHWMPMPERPDEMD